MSTIEKTEPGAEVDGDTLRAERAKPTAYMVLMRDGSGLWSEFGTFDGTNAQHAIRNAVKTGTDGETFVAVPKRSWRPMTRKVEQVTKETWA